MTVENGRSGVVREALAGAAAELDRGSDQVQLAMFAPATRFDGEKGDEIRRTLEDHHGARGAGRPEGATNVSTRQLREYLLGRGVSPLQNMMRWAMHTPDTLATELSCTRLEAFDRLRSLWADLAPYLHARMAPVDDQGNAVMPNFAMFIGGQAVGLAGGLPPWLLDPEVKHRLEGEVAAREQNQGVSGSDPQVSHEDSRTNDASD